jgi:hypothetical protein
MRDAAAVHRSDQGAGIQRAVIHRFSDFLFAQELMHWFDGFTLFRDLT